MAKLTVAVTPSSLFSFFSIRVAHDAQVIPLMASSTEWLSVATAVIGACSLRVRTCALARVAYPASS